MLATLRERIRNGFGRHTDDLWGAILVVAALLVGLSYFTLAGPIGAGIVTGLEVAFGVWGYAVAPSLLFLGALLLVTRHRDDYRRVALGFVITFATSLAMFHLMTGTVSLASSLDLVRDRGGAVGSLLAFPLRRLIGFWGALVVLLAFTALGVLLMTRTTVREALRALQTAVASGRERLRSRRRRRPVVEVRSVVRRGPAWWWSIPIRSGPAPGPGTPCGGCAACLDPGHYGGREARRSTEEGVHAASSRDARPGRRGGSQQEAPRRHRPRARGGVAPARRRCPAHPNRARPDGHPIRDRAGPRVKWRHHQPGPTSPMPWPPGCSHPRPDPGKSAIGVEVLTAAASW
jgi:hypothetical protein